MNMAIEEKDILVRMLPTPNPFALKFVVNQPLKREGKATFYSSIECDSLPLVRDIFAIPGVRQVHVFQNTVTVTHMGELPDTVLADQVEMVLKTRLTVHNADFDLDGKPKVVKAPRAHTDPQIQQIEEILDRTIRPGLQADGGDIEVMDFKDNELTITYQGACGGCPSSLMGTLDAIQGILRNELNNEAISVTPVGE
jgi:NFU1 iron-sulfur cluster scaffold homolog, mitochondrial